MSTSTPVQVPKTGTPKRRVGSKASNSNAVAGISGSGQKATSSQRPRARTERQGRTNRSLTCANCRIRKTRCDGTQPGCKTCEVYQDTCRYEKPPPMSQIIAMAKRLQEAEATLEKLKRKGIFLEDDEQQTPSERDEGSSTGPPTISEEHRSETDENVSHGRGGSVTGGMSYYPIRSPSKEQEPTSEVLLSDLSLDENGKLCYYGPTSAVHDPPALESQSPHVQDYSDQSTKVDVRTMLTSNAMESRAWEEFALGNAAVQSDIPRATMSKLLQIHWAWIAPMFMWVYRPAFMRDMTTGGQYFSQFLLTVLCAHAARFHEGKIGEILISRARLLLGTEIHRPSSIPTVQALLQLSARDLAYGSISQSWLYSGMAFRMVSDLGLHHSSGKILSLGYLTPEDLEIRRRLFWSCYFWDKAISLYLGRMPALAELPYDHTPELLDDFAEHELWTPYYGDHNNLSKISPGQYPPMKAHAISCFENSCKIAVIINDIILQLYSRRGATDVDTALRGIRDRLDEWREKSPSHLKYEPENLPAISPPPHILTQNLLYYTTTILLHRPFYSTPIHHTACRKASDSVEKLLLCLEQTFGFTRITYLMAYCIYTAASVMIQDVKAGDVAASAKMNTFLRALKGGITTCPVVQRSLDIINNSLHSKASTFTMGGEQRNDESLITRNYLPAFPYQEAPVDFSEANTLGSMDLDAFSLLDCFPENHMDNVGTEWYLP